MKIIRAAEPWLTTNVLPSILFTSVLSSYQQLKAIRSSVSCIVTKTALMIRWWSLMLRPKKVSLTRFRTRRCRLNAFISKLILTTWRRMVRRVTAIFVLGIETSFLFSSSRFCVD
ncbi:uncharacterized protein TRIVIDRAFT_216822 [Trichoderma virens Gv29-8]|uniref:Uncharacterized protein n=1 Tax=Hypocrea virens (strain Gv29-8 / FGSC 10586) TaxID=413071 RepID=G9N6C9_HYPVG|nr:uncharacterized protein TRIVIDRAFT_216822 [Trichoderma virens Gv29-8]EHK17691.1 hypothetical protein TRIVIDRAFT_216822 [Trichoderma virens Gv29-8]